MFRVKKIFSFVISVVLLFNIMLSNEVIFFNDVEAADTYALNETFDTYTTGASASGQGASTIWPDSDTWVTAGTSQVIVEDPSSTDKSIKISITSSAASGAQARMRKTVNTVNNNIMVLESKFKINDTNLSATGSLYFYRIRLLHSNTKTSEILNIPGNSTATGARMIQAGNDTAYTNIMPYSLNQWYNVKFIINATTGTYDVYIAAEGNALEKKATGLALNSKTTADYTTGNFTAVQVFSYKYAAGGGTGEFYISDIKLFAPDNNITISSMPANNETRVKTDSDIVINFNNEMDLATLNTTNIIVTDEANNEEPYTLAIGNKNITLSFNNTLKSGNDYFVTINNLNDIYGNILDAQVIKFTTTLLPIVSGVQEGAAYRTSVTPSWQETDGISYSAKLAKDNGVAADFTNGTQIIESGIYALSLTAQKGELTETKEINFTIEEPKEPTASNVLISGLPTIGYTLIAHYTYNDVNGDEEQGSEYRWLRSNDANGVYEVISGATGITSAQDGATYTISEDDIDKYIKFEIVPVSSEEPHMGTAVLSKAFLGPATPFVDNVTIEGEAKVDKKLSGNYDYFDANNDMEKNSVYRWLISNNENGTYVEVGNDISYTIKGSDAGKYIKFEVTPHTLELPSVGITKQSGAIKIENEKAPTKIKSSGGGSYIRPIATPSPTPIITNELTNPSQKLKDIAAHWAKQEIEYMVDLGIVNGFEDNTFKPDIEITRAEFVAFLIRALKLEDTEGSNVFDDVNQDDWYSNYVVTAYSNNIISGSGNEFRPNESITREEITKMVIEAYRIKTNNEITTSGIEKFEDSDEISDWAMQYVDYANSLGLIKGMTDRVFSPKSSATRAQAIAIIKRLIEKQSS